VTDPNAARPEKQAIISILDTGIGIQPILLDDVFELFARADMSYARQAGGLGIGLSLVKSLVELHGGTVKAVSEGVGKGSEFIVSLPLPRIEVSDEYKNEPLSTPEMVETSVRLLRILIVDDNEDVAESEALLLSQAGHEIRVANSGEEALDIAPSFQPEAVILDIGMPGMDGYEVARRLRNKGGLEKTKLIALSGYGSKEDLIKAREAGFDIHLTKPVEIDTLTKAISMRRP
jgi:two-component system CheB/CheR fusion protein